MLERLPAVVLSFAVLASFFWTGGASAREFATLRVPAFSYVQAQLGCLAEMCVESDVGNGDALNYVGCINQCEAVTASSYMSNPWSANGDANWFYGDYFLPNTHLFAEGERLSEGQFVVSGEHLRVEGGALELAVLRYSGGPSELEDQHIGSVDDMVDLGLIAPEDILFVKSDFAATHDDPKDVGSPSSFSFEVAVTGIPDAEIAVFVSGVGVERPNCSPNCADPVPAMGPLAAVVLTLSLLVLSYRQLSRRRSANTGA
jgi:hypothetical protein